MSEYRFEVALSFPGEQRDDVVEPLAQALAGRYSRERVLYDHFHAAEFARLDLDVYLPKLYSDDSRLIVIVLCPDYASKRWCLLELRHIRQLIATDAQNRIMLLRVGDPGDLSPLGIVAGDGFVDISAMPAAEVCALIAERIRFNEHGPRMASATGAASGSSAVEPAIDVSRLLQYAPQQLIGREAEMQLLEGAWAQAQAGAAGRARVLVLEALGGEGKTALVAKWLTELSSAGWPGAEAAFAWSFYSQGSSGQAGASSDIFLSEALTFFGDADTANSAKPADAKARRLLQLLRARRVLLILDGLEPLQYPPSSPLRGKLKDGAVATLLKGLAAQSPGLCVVTTRYAVADLAGAGDSARHHPIERLSTAAGVALLKARGVRGQREQLEAAVEEVAGHALTLNLLGGYLSDAHHGDVRRRDRVRFEEADAESQGGHAFRVMDSYVAWFEAEGEPGRQAMALLRLMGLFDRPAAARVFEALLKPPVIEGLTEAVAGLSEERRNVALRRLQAVKLLTVERDDAGMPSLYDAHPLIREYFAVRLREGRPEAWRAGHQRLFDYLCDSTEQQPATLALLQPLYQAVAHGCLAGQYEKACAEVYRDRILRGTGDGGFYSTKKLGAFGADLGAVACFFDPPWSRPAPALTQGDQGWLLNQAAFRLRGLGRLHEALEPMRAALEMQVAQESWDNAAIGAGNLSELALTLGQLADALGDAEQSVAYADRSGDAFQRMARRTTLADAQHQAGRRDDAAASFEAAEAMQAERQPGYPLLYSMPGFRYCDLLLAAPERAAWRQLLQGRAGGDYGEALASCHEVTERAEQTQPIAVRNNWLLDIALDHLSLGRTALYQAILGGAAPARASARSQLDAAVEALRRAGTQHHVPRGLLSRAMLRAVEGRLSGADSTQEDLDEAWAIAAAGPMRLFLADIHLHRARLFYAAAAYPWDSPAADLAEARRLIEECGYGRRREELADAEGVML